jgi:hypothetical protein
MASRSRQRRIRKEYSLYIGPDSLMPIASAFAAVAGFLLMFWRRVVGMVKFLFHRLTGRTTEQ